LDRHDKARDHEERRGDQGRLPPATAPVQTPRLPDEGIGSFVLAGRARRNRQRHRRPSIM
jgi:hypothetical protein